MGRQCYVARRRRKKSVSVAEVWLVPLMERYYEPNKVSIVAVAVVLLPFCIRFVIPSVEMSKFVMLSLPLPQPQLWNVIHSWLTPPMLFLLLNLVIGTIAVTSTRNPSKQQQKKKKKKINNAVSVPWNRFGTNEESFEECIEDALEQTVSTPLVEPSHPIRLPKRTHKPSPPVESHELSPLVEPPKPPSLVELELHPSLSFSHVGRNESESPAFLRVFEVPPTGDLMSSFEDDASTNGPTTDELNAKADDFIQKFKQQLVLQRLQSYRERKRVGK